MDKKRFDELSEEFDRIVEEGERIEPQEPLEENT